MRRFFCAVTAAVLLAGCASSGRLAGPSPLPEHPTLLALEIADDVSARRRLSADDRKHFGVALMIFLGLADPAMDPALSADYLRDRAPELVPPFFEFLRELEEELVSRRTGGVSP